MLLLASASPARRRLLEQAAIPYSWQVSGVDEAAIRNTDPAKLVEQLAQAKAEAVLAARGLDAPWQANQDAAKSVDVGPRAAISAVLGCDSLLCVGGETFGKPADAQQARARWLRLAGGSAQLLTGHCLLWPGGRRCTTVTTTVVFAALSTAEIDRYIASGEPLACAGGFALEGLGGLVVERLDGCWSNVIGLSLPLLRRWLTPLGYSPLGGDPPDTTFP